jgi:energy-coupling factor transporter ATP-binding protein EcfA2
MLGGNRRCRRKVSGVRSGYWEDMRIKSNSPRSGSESPFRLPDGSDGFFVDREKECDFLSKAILRGNSLMITGPSGAGKTALVRKAVAELPPVIRGRCLYVGTVKDLQDLLRCLIRALNETEEPKLKRELHVERVSKLTFEPWLRGLSTSRLRGTLYRSVEGAGCRVVLDHFPHLTSAMARVIKELFWMRQTPVCLIPSGEESQTAVMMASHFFYWGESEQLRLGPLPLSAAQALLDNCIERFGLASLDLEEFKKQVPELSRCVPGAIVKMCSLASDPRYQYGSRIKTKLVHIDCLIRGRNANDPKRSLV